MVNERNHLSNMWYKCLGHPLRSTSDIVCVTIGNPSVCDGSRKFTVARYHSTIKYNVMHMWGLTFASGWYHKAFPGFQYVEGTTKPGKLKEKIPQVSKRPDKRRTVMLRRQQSVDWGDRVIVPKTGFHLLKIISEADTVPQCTLICKILIHNWNLIVWS